MVYEDSYPKQPEEIVRITGITDEMLKEFGSSPKECFEYLEKFCAKHKVDYLCGHNAIGFDQPFLLGALDKYGVSAPTLRKLPVIDTRLDLPFATEPDSRKLKHLALDIGVINHFPHRAITDVLTMLLVLDHYDIKHVIEYQSIPFVTIRALVSYEDRELAKKAYFQWEKVGDKTYPKCWVKRIKVTQLDAEKAKHPFKIAEI